MLFHKQTKNDCFRTCVACILDLDIWSVPDWYGDIVSAEGEGESEVPEGVTISMDAWFHARGLSLIEQRFRPAPDWWENPGDGVAQFIRGVGMLHVDVPMIVAGMTIKGVVHSVVYRNGTFIHDPAPVRQPIVYPLNEKKQPYYAVYMIGISGAAGWREKLKTFLETPVDKIEPRE